MGRKCIITGAAGFTGSVLTELIRKDNIEVYAVVRPGSEHNLRLSKGDVGLHVIELDAEALSDIPKYVSGTCDVFYHLLWVGGKTFENQKKNIDIAITAIDVAKKCGCKRIVITGSQAEYGVIDRNAIETEDFFTNPITVYGAVKLATCHLTRIHANELGVEWIWGRIFSLIGKNEPKGRMLPDLYDSLVSGNGMTLSSCRQYWDYLDVHDAAVALKMLSEKGNNGEIYNIARGDFKPLIEFTELMRQLVAPDACICYGDDPNPYIVLRPSVEKLKYDTGWAPKISFEDSIKAYGAIRNIDHIL